MFTIYENVIHLRTGYDSKHIIRKIFLWAMRRAEQEVQGGGAPALTALASGLTHFLGPDVSRHGGEVPKAWCKDPAEAKHGLQQWAPQIHWSRYNMWSCLLGTALKLWAKKGHSDHSRPSSQEFEAAMEHISARMRHSPHPWSAFVQVLADRQRQEREASAGALQP